jgi:mRNA-degrading endonuclease RelE of RelBE toxin-antitoxin system
VSFAVFKLRVKNTDIQKGKSGGYRLIYYVQTATGIVLVTIYAKSEQANMTATELQTLIKQYEAE